MKTFKIVGEDLSDGYHTFDELYQHRNVLFLALCAKSGWPCWWKQDGPDWIILFALTPMGQVSYHLPVVFRAAVLQLEIEEKPENVWDGHTSGEVVDRIVQSLSAEVKR